jgi:hypothetical protein
MLKKTLIALATVVVVGVPMSTGASAQDGFAVGGFPGGGFRSGYAGEGWRGGGQDSWRNDGWGPTYLGWRDGCIAWRQGRDWFGDRRLVQTNTCY